MIAPSRITLASDPLEISPSVTFDPATFPVPETLNIYKIWAVPVTVSCTSGESKPDIFCFI